MVLGLRPLAGFLLAVALALAGCTSEDASPAGEEGASTPGPRAAATPEDVYVNDTGQIQGPFAKVWTLDVPNVAFASAHIEFSLTASQPASPPTARVNLELKDPAGEVVRAATVGLGAPGNGVAWSLTAADLPSAGAYTLHASAATDNALPSIGLATYTLTASVQY